MTGLILRKVSGICFLLAVVLSPQLSYASIQISFDFNTTILDVTPSSPLSEGDKVSGSLKVDFGEEFFSDPPDSDGVSVSGYSGPNTLGSAKEGNLSWEQPGTGLWTNMYLINDMTVTADDLTGLPPYANNVSFPDFPALGDEIDVVIFEVISNDLFTADYRKTFSLAFMYDAVEDVVTGHGWTNVNTDKLFTSFIFGEFIAEVTEFGPDFQEVWTATGPIGASVVPIPATVWLLGSGLLGLLGFRNRNLS